MSVTVNSRYDRRMGRWQPDSRGRLQEAALELYAARGYDRTTVAEIAERAGVTERTFFRHFDDKREVLFGGSAALLELILSGVRSAPAGDGPVDAVGRGLVAAAEQGPFRRDLTRRRNEVIAASPELRERERAKLADYAASVAAVLVERGASELQSTLAAEAGATVLRVAMERWAEPGEDRSLADVVREALAELRALAADG